MPRLGLIAGNGLFPLEVARAARARGAVVAAIAHINETDPGLAPLCESLEWVRVGELQRIIDFLKAAHVTEAALAGGISRARLKDSFVPDRRALAMLTRAGRLSDDSVLRALAAEVESEGIAVIDPVVMLPQLLAGRGLIAGPAPTPAQTADLVLAFSIARALGGFDIGQTVAVMNGVVAAVEAIEGTDAALRRAAALSGRGLVIAKAARPGQDLRFDRPAIGPDTVDLMRETGAAVLGIEAGVAMVLEHDRTLANAAQAGITIFGHD